MLIGVIAMNNYGLQHANKHGSSMYISLLSFYLNVIGFIDVATHSPQYTKANTTRATV